jgi:hypothetical protein
VSMFIAAFDTLYAGVGAWAKSGAIVIDPTVDELCSPCISSRQILVTVTHMLNTFFCWPFRRRAKKAAVV